MFRDGDDGDDYDAIDNSASQQQQAVSDAVATDTCNYGNCTLVRISANCPNHYCKKHCQIHSQCVCKVHKVWFDCNGIRHTGPRFQRGPYATTTAAQPYPLLLQQQDGRPGLRPTSAVPVARRGAEKLNQPAGPIELYTKPCVLPNSDCIQDFRFTLTIAKLRKHFNPFTGKRGEFLRGVPSSQYRTTIPRMVPKYSHMLKRKPPSTSPITPSQTTLTTAATTTTTTTTIVDDSEASGGDDLSVTTRQLSLECPILGSRMINPVRLALCGHLIDESVANQYQYIRWPSNWPVEFEHDEIADIPKQPCCVVCSRWIPWVEQAHDVSMLMSTFKGARRLEMNLAENIWYNPDDVGMFNSGKKAQQQQQQSSSQQQQQQSQGSVIHID